MTLFDTVPPTLYRHVEPQAGEIRPALTGRYRASRPREEFHPNWTYLLSGTASTDAVVAGLCCGDADVPEHAWEGVLRQYCPAAWRLLAEAEVSFAEWNTGRCEVVLAARVGATANRELGYEVFAVLDVPAAVATVVAALGAVPEFSDADVSATGDVVDAATGRPRLLADKCVTCIYRPGNLMHLNPGRREQMERDANARGSWIVCHRTLPISGIPVGRQGLCRGYWDVNKHHSAGCRLAQHYGGPVEVPEPPTKD